MFENTKEMSYQYIPLNYCNFNPETGKECNGNFCPFIKDQDGNYYDEYASIGNEKHIHTDKLIDLYFHSYQSEVPFQNSFLIEKHIYLEFKFNTWFIVEDSIDGNKKTSYAREIKYCPICGEKLK